MKGLSVEAALFLTDKHNEPCSHCAQFYEPT